MLVRLIGPVTVQPGTVPVRVTAPKRACVLACLAAHPGTPVTHTALIDRVWDGDPPDAVTNTLYSYIARLRADLRPAGAGTAIRRAGPHGYVLDVEPDAIDVHRMRRLAARAAERYGAGDVPGALESWRRACALAAGEALPGIGGRWADGFRTAFARERTALFADRYAAELAAGRHAACADELSTLAAAGPLAEPLTARLMLALYRTGRSAEALERYEETRVRLRDELGADPSGELRTLHRRILAQDPALEPPDTTAAAGDVPAPSLLPTPIASFTAREAQLAALTDLALRGRPALVRGHAGAGKTALAVHWGRLHAGDFPGGRLYINLRGFDRDAAVSPRDALGRLLTALGSPGDTVPDDLDAAAEAFRSRTAGRRVLVVLDNAATAEQVRPLLPGDGCFTIVTSRNTLPGLMALDDAVPVTVGMLDRTESIRLLRSLLGGPAVDADPAAADTLAHLCGDLPLALRIAAANLAGTATGRISVYVRQLQARDRLAMLAVDGDPDATVTAALDLSYADLPADARALFARLGAVPGEDASGELITAVSGLPEAAAEAALRRLAAGHLVEEHKPGRYRMHDLVRLYAAGWARKLPESDRAEIAERFIAWHHERYTVADIDDELNILAAVEDLSEHPRMWRMLRRLASPLNANRFLTRARSAARTGLKQAERDGDRRGMFDMHVLLTSALYRAGDTETALRHSEICVALAEDLGDEERIVAKGNLGLHLVDRDHRQAADLIAAAADLALAAGDRRLQVINAVNLAKIAGALGAFTTATRYLDLVEAANPGALSPGQRCRFAMLRASVLLDRGRNEEVLDAVEHASTLARDAGERKLDGFLLVYRSTVLRRFGRPAEALDAIEAAMGVFRGEQMDVNEPGLEYAAVHVALGEYERALQIVTEAEHVLPRVAAHYRATSELVRATAHHGLGEAETALEHARRSVAVYAAMASYVRQVEALGVLAELYEALGRNADAERCRAEAAEITAGFEEG